MQYSLLNTILSKKLSLKSPALASSLLERGTSTPKKQRAFSLIELMITVAVGGVVLAVALPSLGNFNAKMRVDNEVSELQRLLLTARNIAINTGQNAQVCPLQGNVCLNTDDWTGRIGVVSDADGLIKERSAITDGDQLVFTHTSAFTSNTVIYTPSGQLSNTKTGVFSYCPQGYTDYSRGVSLSLAGRVYLSTDISGNGVDQDRDGNPIDCS